LSQLSHFFAVRYDVCVEDLIKLPLGLKEGRITHISEVSRGLLCGCVCPGCHKPLVAKKGRITTHHFAHFNTADCGSAIETALHRAAKDIIYEHKKIAVPPIEIPWNSFGDSMQIASEQLHDITSAVLEHKTGNIVPDIVVTVASSQLLIEIRVTHKVDENKAKKIQELRIPTIEIDLSSQNRTFALDELAQTIIFDISNKRWIYSAKGAFWHDRLVGTGQKKQKVFRGPFTHIDDCPKKSRTWKGKHYASLCNDCLQCEFLFENRKREIICGGYSRIRSFRQLKRAIRDRNSLNDLR
jgi:hypothetical protein